MWVVVAQGFAPWEALSGDNWGEPITLEPGTRLRYDQRDWDISYYWIFWDRYCVLNGPNAGRCVLVPQDPTLRLALAPVRD